MKERSRFLRGIISWVGYKQERVEFEAPARFAGKTKYSFGKMFAFAVDGITSFSSFPLKLSIYLGLLVAFFSFINLVYAIYIRLFTNRAIEGWTSVMVAVLFIGGVQLIFLGVLGEYLGRVFEETKQRPLYIISKKVGI
jgi:dolichol-phosphate mannosyltransferase